MKRVGGGDREGEGVAARKPLEGDGDAGAAALSVVAALLLPTGVTHATTTSDPTAPADGQTTAASPLLSVEGCCVVVQDPMDVDAVSGGT